MAFKANRNQSGSGNWIGSTDIWNDPRATIQTIVKPTVASKDIRPASPAQLKYLKDLFSQRSNNIEAKALRLGALKLFKDGQFSITVASDFIAVVKRLPRDN